MFLYEFHTPLGLIVALDCPYISKELLLFMQTYDGEVSRFPGGGDTWVYRGAHTFVIKIKKYP